MAKSRSIVIDDMPVIVSLIYSIHGNEASGVNASLAVAYHLAAAQGPEIEELLDQEIVVMTPGANPDGINRFASWVNSSRSFTNVSDIKSREFTELGLPVVRTIIGSIVIATYLWHNIPRGSMA